MYKGYMDPYKPPSKIDLARYSSALKEKIFGAERQRKHPDDHKQKNVVSSNIVKMKELPDNDLFEYVPMF